MFPSSRKSKFTQLSSRFRILGCLLLKTITFSPHHADSFHCQLLAFKIYKVMYNSCQVSHSLCWRKCWNMHEGSFSGNLVSLRLADTKLNIFYIDCSSHAPPPLSLKVYFYQINFFTMNNILSTTQICKSFHVMPSVSLHVADPWTKHQFH